MTYNNRKGERERKGGTEGGREGERGRESQDRENVLTVLLHFTI